MSYDQRNPSTEVKNGNVDANRTNTTRKAKKSGDDKSNLLKNGLNAEGLPKNYWQNNERLENLMQKHTDFFHEKYDERRVEDMDKMAVSDLFIFFQECFYSDDILVMERETDEQDFFQSINSYRRMLKIAESYFIKKKKKEDVREAQITYDECFEILDYWFQTDENVILITEAEKENLKKNGGKKDVKAVLMETIEKYEKLIAESKSEVEKQILEATVETLSQKLEQLEAGESYSPEREARKEKMLKALRKKEEKRVKALREIFDFYSKQQLNGVKATTFEKLDKQSKSINMGKFSVILSNYQMKIDQLKLKEAFNLNKVLTNSEELNFEQFYSFLQKIAKDVEFITEKKIVKPNPDIMKEYKPDTYKQIPSLKTTSRNEHRKGTDNSKNPKNENMKIEEMWEHMGLYDGSYKNNFQPLYAAFHSHEGPANEKVKYKSAEQRTADEIVKRNELRKEARDGKAIEHYLLKNFKDAPKPIMERSSRRKADSYAALQADKVKEHYFDKKLTLKEVERYQYMEIKKMGIEGKFSPNDLIEENDEEDNHYLAEYNIPPEEKKRKSQVVVKDDLKKPDSVQRIKMPSTSSVGQSYSRMYNSKSSRDMSGGTPMHYVSQSNILPKSSMLDDTEYVGRYKTPKGINYQNDSHAQAVYQAVKQPNSHQNQLNYLNSLSPSSYNIKSVNQPSSQRAGGINQSKKYAEYVLDRASQVQQEAQRKEYLMMNNAMNYQNSKIEQGLRVARRY